MDQMFEYQVELELSRREAEQTFSRDRLETTGLQDGSDDIVAKINEVNVTYRQIQELIETVAEQSEAGETLMPRIEALVARLKAAEIYIL